MIALKDVIGEEAAHPELGDSQVERAHACLEAAIPIAVPAVGLIAAELVGLLVHVGVHDLFGDQPEQRLDADYPVGRPRDSGLLRYRVCKYLHSGSRSFPEPVFVAIPDSRTGAACVWRLTVGTLTPIFLTRSEAETNGALSV